MKNELYEIIGIEKEKRSHITTKEAAIYLNRKPQTLRSWACFQNGPIQPINIHGRLSWPVNEIKEILGINDFIKKYHPEIDL